MSACTYTMKEISLKLSSITKYMPALFMVAYIFYCIIIVYNILFILFNTKNFKNFYRAKKKKKKKKAGSMYIPVIWDANYDCENNDYTKLNDLRPHCFKFYMIVFHMLDMFYL